MKVLYRGSGNASFQAFRFLYPFLCMQLFQYSPDLRRHHLKYLKPPRWRWNALLLLILPRLGNGFSIEPPRNNRTQLLPSPVLLTLDQLKPPTVACTSAGQLTMQQLECPGMQIWQSTVRSNNALNLLQDLWQWRSGIVQFELCKTIWSQKKWARLRFDQDLYSNQ